MRFFIGIPTTGRASVLSHALDCVENQSLVPDCVIICTPYGENSHLDLFDRRVRTVEIKAPKGSCSQRNAILDYLSCEEGLLLIIDDDFLLMQTYLEEISRILKDKSDIALANGKIILDGISGPGLDPVAAKKLLTDTSFPTPINPIIRDIPHAYGCNMVINLVLSRETRFDEMLRLYGWQEDVDYSARLRKRGRIVSTNIYAGVHLGTKLGRTSGEKFGYSQVINPLYLLRKGTMSPAHSFGIIFRNVFKNVLMSFRPEPYIDRRGRLRGNISGIKDLIRFKIDPLRVERF